MRTAEQIDAEIQALLAEKDALKGPRILGLVTLWNAVTLALRDEYPDALPEPVMEMKQQAMPRPALVRRKFDMSETQMHNAVEKAGNIVKTIA